MARLYYMSSDSDNYMPWLHGPGVTCVDILSVIQTLASEIRRCTLKPKSRPKSPMPMMRREIKNLLEAAEDDDREISSPVAAAVITTLDLVCIDMLAFRCYSIIPTDEDWEVIGPNLTVDLLSGMCEQNFGLQYAPYPASGPHLQPAVSHAIARSQASSPGAHYHIGKWSDAYRNERIDRSIYTTFISALIEHSTTQTWEWLFTWHNLANDPIPLLACLAVQQNPDWDLDFNKITDPERLKIAKYTSSNHGQLFLKGALKDMDTFLRNPGPALEIIMA